MADQIELLKQLQVLDGDLFRLRRQQEQKPQELEALRAQLAEQEAQVKATEQRVKDLQLAQKEKELELQTREANVRKLQSQLFQLKTNREYTTMQREIDTLKADNSLLEETILKAFDDLDETAKARQRAQQALEAAQARVKIERARIEQELAQLGEQLAALERQRKLLAPDVPPTVLAAYERVLEIREGLALVPLLENSCGGCHRRLPPQVLNEVYLRAKLVTCEHCNRILYFDEAHSKL
jgi:predicted  nucleic acid-binding Zn-ribbon protein